MVKHKKIGVKYRLNIVVSIGLVLYAKHSQNSLVYQNDYGICEFQILNPLFSSVYRWPTTFGSLGSFGELLNSVLNKGKSAIPPLFNGPEVLYSASDKAKLFAKIFSKNSNLDDSGISYL